MSGYARLSSRIFGHIDWFLFFAALGLSMLGLVTMYPLGDGGEAFFDRQIIWISLALIVFFFASLPEYTFLRRTQIVTALYVLVISLLALIFVTGTIVKGAQQRFDFGFFALQP